MIPCARPNGRIEGSGKYSRSKPGPIVGAQAHAQRAIERSALFRDRPTLLIPA